VAGVANAAVHEIDVGMGGSLAFSPNSLTAAVGDTLEFHFFSGSGGHSVVSSTFQSPCVPTSNAFFSGYIPGNTAGDMTFVVNVTSTDPIWFYCSLASHCQSGMSGVINAPSGETIDMYMSAAQSVAKASAPTSLQGGVLETISTGAVMTATTAASSTTGGASTTTATSTTTGASTTKAGTTSSVASGTTSAASSAATTKASGAGRNRELSIAFGLTVVAGGLVALMA